MPIVTLSGSQPTMLVVMRITAWSSSSTMATTYGGSSPGYQGWWLMVNDATVPRPLVASASSRRDRHCGQMGAGGWTQYLQSWQRRHAELAVLAPRPEVTVVVGDAGEDPERLVGVGHASAGFGPAGRNTGTVMSSVSSRNATSSAMPTSSASTSQSSTLVIMRGPSSRSTTAAT